jgi:hypothetical protein
MSYSRNNEIYQYFNDSLSISYAGNGDEINYTELTVSHVDRVIEDLKCDIDKSKTRLQEYEKHASGNLEIIEEILNQKDYLNDLEGTLYQIYCIRNIVEESTYSWNDYNKVLCNID